MHKKWVEIFICSSVLLCEMNGALQRLRWHTTKHFLPCVRCCCYSKGNAVDIRKMSTIYRAMDATCVIIVHSCLSLFPPFVHTAKIFTVAHRVYEIDSILLLWLLVLLSRYLFSLFLRSFGIFGVFGLLNFPNQMISNYNSIYVTRKLHRTIINDVLLFCTLTWLCENSIGLWFLRRSDHQREQENMKLNLKIVVVCEVEWTFWIQHFATILLNPLSL